MKNLNKYNIVRLLLLLLVVAPAISLFQACNNEIPGEYVIAEGTPEIYYVRLPDPSAADSLIVAAYMDNTICLVGDYLNSIKEIYFNDQQATLNNSLITKNTLFVNVPKTIPGLVTNKIYMVTGTNDTIQYDFSVLVPAPTVASMSCEYVQDGDVAILYGDYFIEDPNVPLSINMPGNIPVTEIISISKLEVKFVVPEGSQSGYINVSSIYGSSRSKFQFRDKRGMILDWDNTNAAGGWRSGVIRNGDPIEGITGNYVYFHGELQGGAGASWAEDQFSFNLWGSSNNRPEGDLFDIDPATALLKFEINVIDNWASGALQMIFTPWETKETNSYIADGITPRGLWYPWLETGSYTTDGWITVSFPLSEFIYNHEGVTMEQAPKGNYGGLTFFVWHGGIAGTDCVPTICIDNIRVVPAE